VLLVALVACEIVSAQCGVLETYATMAECEQARAVDSAKLPKLLPYYPLYCEEQKPTS
jgi:hypothetical protein